jgi:hypothetical protein
MRRFIDERELRSALAEQFRNRFPIPLAAPVMRTTLPEKSKTRENSSALSSAKSLRDIQRTSMFSCLTAVIA